ncbi:MAG: beta-N-acetylhexosaminidase [Phycisphaerae bacterium]
MTQDNAPETIGTETYSTTAANLLPVNPLPVKLIVRSQEQLPLRAPISIIGRGLASFDLQRLYDVFNDYASRRWQLPMHLGTSAAPPSVSTIALELRTDLPPHFAGVEYPWQRIEAYSLSCGIGGAVITAPAYHGLFNGLMTLLQLATRHANGRWHLPNVAIEDYPRLHWRGYMLDVSRHFFDTAEVKRLLAAMALFKLNRFHWHLSDHQGWRIPIEGYPKLISVGAWRSSIGFNFAANLSNHYNSHGQYGGFYTHQQIEEVVAFAAERHITIVPEIDMPGHTGAAIAAYPALSCSGQPIAVSTSAIWSAHDPCLCVGDKRVYQFADRVIGTLADLFPGRYIHTGGDEVKFYSWQHCPKCLALAKRHHIKTMPGLQAYFEHRMNQIVRAHGKLMIGWDEILYDLPRDAAIMAWHSQPQVIERAIQENAPCVRAPTAHMYFDYTLTTTPPQKVYAFNPADDGLAGANDHLLLGSQACLWTEWVPNMQVVQERTFPRLCAAAEVFWTPQHRRNWQSFAQRLPHVFVPNLADAALR